MEKPKFWKTALTIQLIFFLGFSRRICHYCVEQLLFLKMRLPVPLTTNNFMLRSRFVKLERWMSSRIELKSQDITAGYVLMEKENVLGGKNKT